MTVSTTNSSEVFSGGQSVLNFNFAALVGFPQYIQVSVTALTGGTTTALSYSTQYTVTISSTGVGGTVIVSPSYGTNYNYVVYRQTSVTQTSSYTNYNSFPASTLMSNLDQLTMIDQEQDTTTGLALSYPVGTITSTYSNIAPLPSIGCVMTTNSAGTQWIASAGIAGPVGPSGATGTISLVSSSTSDITVVSTSTTPIITAVNAATAGANTILRLTASGSISTTLMFQGPIFAATGSVQSITNGSFVIRNLGVIVDSGSYISGSTTYLPQVAGYYYASYTDGFQGVSIGTNFLGVSIYKNGSLLIPGGTQPGSNVNQYSATVSGVVHLNGSTDYLSFYVFQGQNTILTSGTAYVSVFRVF